VTRPPLLAALAAIVLLVPPVEPAVAQNEEDVAILRTSFNDGWIYLTYPILSDLKAILRDGKNHPDVAKQRGARWLREFLDSNHPGAINRSVAFLRLGFEAGISEFMLTSDLGVRPRATGWKKSEIIDVAQLVRIYYERGEAYVDDTNQIRSGKRTILQSLANLRRWQADPFISSQKLLSMMGAVDTIVARNGAEYERLLRDKDTTALAFKGTIEALKRSRLDDLALDKELLIEDGTLRAEDLDVNQWLEIKLNGPEALIDTLPDTAASRWRQNALAD
jgi:hypothetical protein